MLLRNGHKRRRNDGPRVVVGIPPSMAVSDEILVVGDRSAPDCSPVLPEVLRVPLAFGVLPGAVGGLLVASATPRLALEVLDPWVAAAGP